MKKKIEFYSTFVKDCKHYIGTDAEFQKRCLENGIGWEQIGYSFDQNSFKTYLDHLKEQMDERHGDTYLQSDISWMIWFKLCCVDDNEEVDDDQNGVCFFWFPYDIRQEGLYKSIPMIDSMFNLFKEVEGFK